MLRLRNVGRDSQQTKRCRRGDTVTGTTANIIGVHIFAIDDAALDGIPDPDAYIVSLSGCRQGRSYTRQYGPVISSDDKASIEDRLRGDIRLIGTSDVIWYALELMRLCPKLRFRRLLSTRSGTARLSPRFKVHVFHDCTLTNRQRSTTIATECYMNRCFERLRFYICLCFRTLQKKQNILFLVLVFKLYDATVCLPLA